MSNKRIEFEIALNTRSGDKAITDTEKRILSLTSNLKESVVKIEQFKKSLENSGNKLPALDLVKQFKDELAKVSRSLSGLKDQASKDFLKQYLAEAKASKLPVQVSGLLRPGNQSLNIGEMSKKDLDKLTNAYSSGVLKGTETLPKKLQDAITSAMKSEVVRLTGFSNQGGDVITRGMSSSYQQQQKAAASWMGNALGNFLKQEEVRRAASIKEANEKLAKDITTKMSPAKQQLTAEEKQKRFRHFYSSSMSEYDEVLKKIRPVKAFQNPQERYAEALQESLQGRKGFKGILSLGKKASDTELGILAAESRLYDKYKPLTEIQRTSALIDALKQKLQTLPQKGMLGEFWGETAVRIITAERALQKYIETERSLKFQKGLNDSVQGFGNAGLANADFNSSNSSVLQRIQRQNQQDLEKVSSRYQNLINRTAAKVDGTTDAAQRRELLARMEMLGKRAEASMSNVKVIGEARLLSTGLRDELNLLKEQLNKKSEIKKKDEEILAVMERIKNSSLSGENTRTYLAFLTQARNNLAEIDKIQKSIVSSQRTNQNAVSYGNSALSSVDQRQALESIQRRYGSGSLRAIDFKERQQLESLKSSASNRIGLINSALPENASPEKLAQHKRLIDQVTASYAKKSEAVRNNSAILRENDVAIQAHLKASSNFLMRITEFVIGYKAVNAALEGFGNFLRNIPDTGIKLENTTAVFKAMFVTTKDVNEQFKFLDAIADRTGGRLKALRTEFGDFSASAISAGESVANVQKEFADLMDVATVLHLPEDKVHSALVAISQMYAKNQVMSEELKRQLGNVLPGAVSTFALSQGMTSRQLLDAMKNSQVMPKDSVPQFLAFYKSIFATTDAFETASKGFYATLGRMENEYTRLSETLYLKSSSTLIGVTETATKGLKLIRENLDGILVVLGSIAAAGTASGLAAAFKWADMGQAKMAMASVNKRTAQTAIGAGFMNPIKRYSPDNPQDLALFAGISNWGKNALTMLTNLHPAIKAVALAVGGLTASWKLLDSWKIDLGDNLSVSGLDYVSMKLKTWWQGLKEFLATPFEVKVQTATGEISSWEAFKQDSAAGWEYFKKEGERTLRLLQTDFQAPIGKAFWTGQLGIPQEDKEILKKQALAARQLEEQKKLNEEVKAANQRGLLQSSPTNIENMFDGKIFTKTIELLGKAVTSQITAINDMANRELAKLDARVANLDRKAQAGMISYGEALDQKIKALQEKTTISTTAKLREIELQDKPVALARTFSEQNTQLQRIEQQKLDFEIEKQKINAMLTTYSLNVKNQQTGEIEPKTYPGMGFVLKTDANGIPVDNMEERLRKQAEAESMRKSYLADLSANAESNPGVKDLISSLPIYTTQQEVERLDAKLKSLSDEAVNAGEALKNISSSLQAWGEGRMDYGKGNKTFEDRIKPYEEFINSYSKEKGVPSDLIKSMIRAESAGNSGAVSDKGATGLMQLMPPTAKQYGVRDLKDPIENLKGGINYVADLYYNIPQTKGDWNKVVQGYNAGQGAVGKYPEGVPYKETVDYTNKVMDFAGASGFIIKQTDKLLPALESLNALDKKDRVAGGAATSKGMEFLLKEEASKLAIGQIQDKGQQDINNLLELFKLDTDQRRREMQDTSRGWARTLQPLDLSLLEEEIQAGFAPILRELDAEAKSLSTNRRFTDEEIAKWKAQIAKMVEVQTLIAKLDQESLRKQARFHMEQMAFDQSWNTFIGNNASPYEQASRQSLRSEMLLKQKRNGQALAFAAIDADPSLLDGQKKEKKAQYLDEIETLKKETESVAYYFKGELSQSMQQPIHDFVMGMSSAEDSLKAFGKNILGSIADNIIQSMSNALSDMLVEAAGKAATSDMMSSLGSSLFSMASSFFASGGSIDDSRPQVFTRTQMIKGLGNETSDSIDALVPKGSYILNAEATRRVKLSNNEMFISPKDVNRIGKNKLDRLNFGGNFAKGGEVGEWNSGWSGTNRKAETGNSTVVNNTYKIEVTMESSGNTKQDGQNLATEIVRQIAAAEAVKAASKAVGYHEKMKHTRG